ncbi:hypothetical protein B0H14DRAFT_1059817 [Mycena olivaceomarginata]|nr:hypothetical protein B0H14DRAFT_1059817 [Mycena olivaceomarginata]
MTSSSIAETVDSQQPAPNTRWPDDWERFTSFTGSVYYISDGGRLITADDVHDPYIRAQVVKVYEEQREWFQDIDADDGEMEVFNVCDQPMVILASWSLGETYENSTDDLKPERRAAFWDYAWAFSAHRKYLPRHLEAEFITALAFVSNDHVWDGKAKAFPFEDAQTRRIWQVYQDLKRSACAFLSPASHSSFQLSLCTIVTLFRRSSITSGG